MKVGPLENFLLAIYIYMAYTYKNFFLMFRTEFHCICWMPLIFLIHIITLVFIDVDTIV